MLHDSVCQMKTLSRNFKEICNITINSSSTDVDECASNPCPNGGTCTNQVGSFKCNCPEGYSGTQCNICKSLSSSWAVKKHSRLFDKVCRTQQCEKNQAQGDKEAQN